MTGKDGRHGADLAATGAFPVNVPGFGSASRPRWLTHEGGPGTDEIWDFWAWAQERGVTEELTVPIPGPREALVALEEGECWKHLRCALSGRDLAHDLRTIAALMLPYGVTFSRVQQLRRDEVEQRSEGAYFALDRREGRRVRLAESVGDLLAGQLAGTADARSDWVKWR